MFNIKNRCRVFISIILLLFIISSSGCNNNPIKSHKQEVPVMAYYEKTQELYDRYNKSEPLLIKNPDMSKWKSNRFIW